MSNDLDPRAIHDLARSGLASTDMLVENVPAPFGASSSGYLIPYFDAAGERHPKMFRMRLYEPDHNGGKYHQPTSEELGNDPTPPYFAHKDICDYTLPAPVKLIVEGEKKAVAAMKYLKLPAIGIGGCWNWAGLHREDEKAAHRARPVHPATMRWLKDGHTKSVEIVFDADMFTNENVCAAGSGLWWALREQGIEARFVVLPPGGGLDDWIMSQPDGAAREAFHRLPRITGENLPVTALNEMFKALGVTTSHKTGQPTHDERITHRLMTRHPRYAGRFWVDMVKHRVMVGDEPLTDPIATGILMELQEFMPKLPSGVAYQTLVRLAWQNQRNLVTEWLDEQTWDGVPRLSSFASRYLCADDTPFTKEAFPNFLTAAVARMFKPGTKFDHMLVLQGAQGIGKTRALIALFGKDYACIAPHTTAIGSRDWLDAGGNGWCLILDELAGLSRVEHGELKTALSTESDTYRRAYRKDPETFPRMFVCAATTNESVFLTDPTGNRRYWPVLCNGVEVDAIVADRAQLWAEAVYLYRSGHAFWHLSPEATSEAEERQEQAHMPDHTEEVAQALLNRAYAVVASHRPPVVQYMGRACYFVGTQELMVAVAGEDFAFAKNAGLTKRIRSAMMRIPGWTEANVYDTQRTRRRGYVMPIIEADAEPRVSYDVSWDELFGRRGSKF